VSLTTGRGPLSPQPAGRFDPPLPDGIVYVEPFPRRVRALDGDRVVIDTERALLVHRQGAPPAFAFPADDLHGVTGEPEAAAPGHMRVPWGAVSEWFEEEEQVFGHPRNPYHRVDCVKARRRLRVDAAGEVLVDTDDVIGVYETALAPRLYVRREFVRMDLLVPSTTTTYCPYKGTATYRSAAVGGRIVEDVAWSYEDPLAECIPIAGLLAFDPARATVVQEVPG
jgi:uncharacterized protein (DUF427 family)